MIADNKIFSLGIENLDTLNSFLEDLQGDLDIPGFDEEILKQMVSEAEDITEKLSEYGTLDEEEIRSIRENAEKKEQQMQRMESGQGEGKSVEEIGKQLGMRPEEVFRLSEFSKEDFLRMMITDQGFSKAEFITKI